MNFFLRYPVACYGEFHFSGIFFWEGVTLLSYDVRILVLGSVCLVFFVWADSRPVKKYCPCFSALYLGRRFGF